ncbi:MAG: glutamine-hydrolyzing carbamoyl-phosphate synthase small subunit [Gammaproteobacteria bacterium AqS3]|nr:glutamine-hydrolyzing carbamoyl-phosphate synthase small subunit [Gammaproteobacteria bacterium AqS3]
MRHPRPPALLALADGTLFWGRSAGAEGVCAVGEVVFNTAMTGYQEILTDPSYARQMVCLTAPHIGNTGVTDEDAEARRCLAAGLIIRDLPDLHSSWRSQGSLGDYLRRRNLAAIDGIDTRALTRRLRTGGVQNGCIQTGEAIDPGGAVALAREAPSLEGADLAREVTTDAPYSWTQGLWNDDREPAAEGVGVVVYDFGVKVNILRMLRQHCGEVYVVPAETGADEVRALNPDGVFLSNGPGDPAPCGYAIEAIRSLLDGGMPLAGICLGHQLLSLACAARTEKMKFGHHGANHPVQDLEDGRVYISSQNHGFAVSYADFPEALRITHRSLFDGSIQGVDHVERQAFSFQGHPEASPGPQDIGEPFFTRFARMIRGGGSA